MMFGSDVNFGIDTEDALTGGLLAEVTDYPWPSQSLDRAGRTRAGQHRSSLWRGFSALTLT